MLSVPFLRLGFVGLGIILKVGPLIPPPRSMSEAVLPSMDPAAVDKVQTAAAVRAAKKLQRELARHIYPCLFYYNKFF